MKNKKYKKIKLIADGKAHVVIVAGKVVIYGVAQ